MQYGYDTNSVPPVPDAPVRSSACPVQGARYAGGVGLGLTLILIGGAFLAAQMVPGLDLWTLWPLIIVAVGVVQMVTPDRWRGWGVERITEGIGTILAGLVLLGCTTGYIGWEMWWTLLMLWPVLLIAAGIGLLGRASHQSWLTALAPVVIWVAMGYAAASAWTGAAGALPASVLTVFGLS